MSYVDISSENGECHIFAFNGLFFLNAINCAMQGSIELDKYAVLNIDVMAMQTYGGYT
jgi:hypothetical protein